MIAALRGVLSYKSTRHVIVDVQGIGYHVFVPLSTFYLLPEVGTTVSLAIHTHVREDSISLFGFHSADEKAIFQRMITVSGIGPRLALNILSGITPDELTGAIMAEDMGRLVTIPGIGRKMAERLIFELREKLVASGIDTERHRSEEESLMEDALSALMNLGYKESIAKKAIDRASKECKDQVSLEVILTESLKVLSK
ncbi:MAG: Holliday junction branch migration protein RuvA [Syntrophales bacterium]|jgi:Holliday junction DNA helicase RuvA|nr:Holliday junction branch migration protein RuvA [Syntrophales bacterium]MCK9527771.1 Holliday junction branch migration protein RuvA [Syntrophales bacterium]MDX9921574.1 Holliday junction branch migration protein RuvA [Syntrophales bacterium]